MAPDKPKIRILRHLARTGGTLITKCLGSMDGVVMLSEVHPENLVVSNPLRQAVEWFDLVSRRQMVAWKIRKGPRFDHFVWACYSKAESRGETLVLRDWSHLDYYGFPFVKAKMGFGLGEALKEMFEVIPTCTVRHPVDQYVSLGKLRVIGEIDWDLFLDGNLAFAEYAAETGFVRYEDLTRDPDGELKKLCGRLQIGFDEGYRGRWGGYNKITGDVKRRSEGSRVDRIRPLERKGVDERLHDAFRGDERYVRVCGLLGYDV